MANVDQTIVVTAMGSFTRATVSYPRFLITEGATVPTSGQVWPRGNRGV